MDLDSIEIPPLANVFHRNQHGTARCHSGFERRHHGRLDEAAPHYVPVMHPFAGSHQAPSVPARQKKVCFTSFDFGAGLLLT